MKLQILKGLAGLQRRIEEKSELVLAMQSERERITPVLSCMPKSSGVEKNRLERKTIEIFELIEKLNVDIETMRAAMAEYDNLMDALTPKEQDVIRLKFKEGKSWTQVRRVMHYGESQPYKIIQKLVNKGLIER